MKKLLTKKIKPKVLGARTRFAPSPTGNIHLGSLRTAAYNYLLAKSTNGQFVLRLEDTDQKRLQPGAEQNIYESLEWAGLKPDEGPFMGGPYGPYRQSERQSIYKKYVNQLLEEKKAYRCFCSHERLDKLAASARDMVSTASYDRKCSHIDPETSAKRAESENCVVRFKSPTREDGSEAPDYPPFEDVLHGHVSVQPQINAANVRYDDFVLVKSDGLPTYHFANIVDDHLMHISHVVRGEEWLASTPKHVALYNAFGWNPPEFVHIPLLMGEDGRKLSKRESARGVLDFATQYMPSAFVNFVALLGWSPAKKVGSSTNEVMTLPELERVFSLDGLTKGNVQVDMSKLDFFGYEHFNRCLAEDFDTAARLCFESQSNLSLDDTKRYLAILKNHVTSPSDFNHKIEIVLAPHQPIELNAEQRSIADAVLANLENGRPPLEVDFPKKKVMQAMRKSLVAGKPGTSIMEIIQILGTQATSDRIEACRSCQTA